MWKQHRDASGYLVIFVMPALLVLGVESGVPSLPMVAMITFPFLRLLFGNVGEDERACWDERLAVLLHRLPLVYALVVAAVLAHVLRYVDIHGVAHDAIGLSLGLWMVMLFATCVAHELLHRRELLYFMAGHCVAGLAGYPALGSEHAKHHARPGDTRSAEWPRFDEAALRFALRRSVRVFADAYSPSSSFWALRASNRHVNGLRLATALTAMTWGLFAWAGGAVAAAIYGGVIVGVTLGTQIATYIQHWGLGDDRQGAGARQGLSWDHECRFQAWITFGISLHQSHHDRSARPYYLAMLDPRSPRLPVGYLQLLLLSLVPTMWRRMMLPALLHWERNAASWEVQPSRANCFSGRRAGRGLQPPGQTTPEAAASSAAVR